MHDVWQAAYGLVHILGHVLGVAEDNSGITALTLTY